MPAGFGGSFVDYALGKSVRPGATRTKTLLGWVRNLAKLRSECQQKIRCNMPSYYHFEESDIAIIEKIASDGRHSPEVAREFLFLLEDINSRKSEIQAFNEGLSELHATMEELKKLEQLPIEIALQKALLAQQEALLAPLESELAFQKQEFAKKQQELALQQQELALKKALLAKQQQEFEQQQLEYKQQQKVFDKKQQSHQNGEVHEPEIFQDNIFTLEVMEEPVIATDGFTYEKRCILEWFRTKRTSPTTGAELSSTQLIQNYSLKSHINQWRQSNAIDAKDKTTAIAKRFISIGPAGAVFF